MLHTKFCGNWPPGSGGDVLRVFTIHGHGGHLGHVTSIILINFHFHLPKSLGRVFTSIFGTETLTKYLRSHTATKSLICRRIFVKVFCHIIFAVVFTRMMIHQRKLPEQNIFVHVN